jgi:16S rRNA (uracil1498-N3)-methyltransferase
MKVHRFYIPEEELDLSRSLWINDDSRLRQWKHVLRMSIGDQLVLFNGLTEDRLYEIDRIEPSAVHLKLVTELVRRVPVRDLRLYFSLLKKDKNEWVVQKATELGVSHFVPLITERTEKHGFDEERMKKIAIEAAEQCGRSDIPSFREPLSLSTAISELADDYQVFYGEQDDQTADTSRPISSRCAVFVGPEGGWTETEKALLASRCQKLSVSDFTLRAETACIALCARLLQ